MRLLTFILTWHSLLDLLHYVIVDRVAILLSIPNFGSYSSPVTPGIPLLSKKKSENINDDDVDVAPFVSNDDYDNTNEDFCDESDTTTVCSNKYRVQSEGKQWNVEVCVFGSNSPKVEAFLLASHKYLSAELGFNSKE